MVLPWVAEEGSPFLEHFALQLKEQYGYAKIICLICFPFRYLICHVLIVTVVLVLSRLDASFNCSFMEIGWWVFDVLVFHCDFQVFATPEVHIGFHPEAAASFSLSHLTGQVGWCSS
jgi:hypothetical protein